MNTNMFAGRKMLLASEDLSGLHKIDGFHILFEFDDKSDYEVFKLVKNKKSSLNKSDFNLTEIEKRLVLPEMEVERIFNNLRYKYLNAIYLSGFANPQKYISAKYNKAYQDLAGHYVYPGNTADRHDRDSYWKSEGFKIEAKDQNWEKERDELQEIIGLLKIIYSNTLKETYLELIAIKPGLHELMLHPDYFDVIPYSDEERDIAFRILKNKADDSELKINELPTEIKKTSYFSFASCYATEGPFMFRKNINITYFNTIKRVRSKLQKSKVYENIFILDYYNADLNNRQKLKEFLREAEKYRFFMHSN
jgi:hypothetical protein